MDAVTASLRNLERSSPLAELARAALLTATAGYFGLSLSLAARRIAGGLTPLEAPLLIALAVSVPAAILLARLLWANLGQRAPRAIDYFVRFAPSASALLVAGAVSLPGTSPPALAALWLAIVGVEAAIITRDLRRRSPRPSHPADNSPRATRPASADSRTTQKLTRQVAVDGAENITGELRASFHPGERTVFLHIAFCPPLPSDPMIECEQLDGPEAEIKIAQVQTYGARFDIRLDSECAEPVDVLLQFTVDATRAELSLPQAR